MKKILTILASLTIVGSTAATVVACGTTSEQENEHLYDGVHLKENVRKQMILKLKNENNLGFDLEDFWDDNTINKIIDNFIDDQVAKNFTKDLENDFNKRLRLEDKNLSSQIQYGLDVNKPNSMLDQHNLIAQEVNNLNYTNALMRFFTQYTASLAINNFNALDFDLAYGKLNPNKIVGQNNGEIIDNISIYYQNDDKTSWNRWTAINDWNPAEGENTPLNEANVSLGKYIPNQAMLSAKSDENRFVLIQNSNKLNLTTLPPKGEANNQSSEPILLLDNISGNDALGYRFQNYLRTKQAENYKNLLTLQFMRNQMFRFAAAPNGTNPNNQPTAAEIAAQQAIYYNTDSHFIRNVQTWANNSGRKFDTDLKMVWTISLKDKTQAGKANEILQQANQDRANVLNDYATFRDKASLYNNDVNESTKGNSILQILSLLTALDGQDVSQDPDAIIKRINDINISESGSDPVFGIKGFQGFVRNSDSSNIEAVLGGNLNIAESAKSKVAKTNVSAVIKSNINGSINKPEFVFDNKNETKSTKDIVVVLPLYLLDIWKTVNEQLDSSRPTATTNSLVDYATNQWVRLLPQVDGSNWTTTRPTASTGWTEVSQASNELPTTNSFRYISESKDGLQVGTYVYIVQNDKNELPTTTPLNLGSNTVDFVWSPDFNKVSRNYGFNGIGQITDRAVSTNGQQVKFNVHLGQDSGLSNTVEQSWNQRDNQFKRNDDIAYYLNGEQKENLTNILMAIVESTHNEIAEEAKGQVYRRYIDPNDIYYRWLYDSLIDYIKIDKDDVEDSD